jgi:hypothetical protein
MAGVVIVWATLVAVGCGPVRPDAVTSGDPVATVAWQVRRVREARTGRVVASEPLTNADWESLRGLRGLRELVVLAGRADDDRADIIASLPDIERLVLRESPLSDEGFRAVASRLTLRDLNVPRAGCTAAGVRALAALPRLRSLRIGGARLAGTDVCAAAVGLPALRTLHFIDIPVGDDGLAVLAGRPDLWSLYLDGAGVSDGAWDRYFAACPHVHVHLDQAHHDRDPARGHE